MKRETRQNRRARLEVQTLEGRELMSAGLVTAINPGHIEHRHLHPRAPRPHHNHPIPAPLHSFDNPPLRAPAGVPEAATTAITASVTAPNGNGSVTLTGQTYRRAKVSLQVNGTNVQTTRSTRSGQFGFTFTVGPGSTTVVVSATAHGHRPTSTTLTVNRTQTPPNQPGNPQPGNPQPAANIPPGTYDYYYTQTTGEETVTNKFTLTVYADRTAELQLALESSDSPFASSPVQVDYFRWLGRLQANGSELELVGEGTEVFTDTSNPALDYERAVTDDLQFPFYQWVQGKGLELTLAKELPDLFSPGGPTRNILLTKIA
jgi:hypothetical protein